MSLGLADVFDRITPPLWKRMACFVYEGLMLFGIGLIPGLLGAVFFKISGYQHPLQSETSLRVFTFAIYGIYFTWCWSKRGQTLPMQTWHIKVVTSLGEPLTQSRAFVRFLLSWIWVAPAVGLAYFMGWTKWSTLYAILTGIVIYAALSRLHPKGQFWHDEWCGTQLISSRLPAAK